MSRRTNSRISSANGAGADVYYRNGSGANALASRDAKNSNSSHEVESFPSVMPLGQFLFEYLHSRGVRHSFGIPGDFVLPTFAWLEKSKIQNITMTHEPAAGFAADAYSRVNGIGLVCVTYCVGGLNVLNAIAGAYAEKSPVVVISGAPGRSASSMRSCPRPRASPSSAR